MKKVFIPIMLSIMFLFSTTAFAAGEDTSSAGVTPDSIMYPVDKLIEDVQLLVTTAPEKEAGLLLDIADERLSEAQIMTEENKIDDAKEAMDGYIETIGDAKEEVLEVLADENIGTDVKNELNDDLQDSTEVDENITDKLGEEQQDELVDAIDEIVISANVVKGIDTEIVKNLRQEGLGFGQIAQIALLSEKTGKTMDEIAELFKDGKGFGDAAKELGLTPSEVKKQAHKEKSKNPAEEDLDTENKDENTAAVENQNTSKVQSLTTAPKKKSDNKEVKASKETKKEVPAVKNSDAKQSDNSKDKKTSEEKKDKGKGKENKSKNN